MCLANTYHSPRIYEHHHKTYFHDIPEFRVRLRSAAISYVYVSSLCQPHESGYCALDQYGHSCVDGR